MKPIVVVGSINMDLVARTGHIPKPGETVLGRTFRKFPGGKGANQAVGVARLNYPVLMLGKLGMDSLGEDLLTHLKSVGVQCEAVGRSKEASSGVALITTEDSGENSIVVVGGANTELSPTDIERHSKTIRSAGMVLLQLEIPLETVAATVKMAHDADVPVVLDPAPAQSLSKSLLQKVSWLTPNETEAGILLNTTEKIETESAVRECSEQLLSYGARNVALKMGAKGSYIATDTGLRIAVPAFSVKAKDTTAAGDAFNAAFAVGILRGMSPAEAALYASAAAAISVTREGAQPSMASDAELREFLGAQKARSV